MSERFSHLRKLMAKASPAPWSSDSERSDGVYGIGDDIHEGFDSFAVYADGVDHYGKPARVCDALNSDVAEVHEEFDEDGHRAWDEVGRRNMEFIAEARDQLPEVLSALDAAEARVKVLEEALETITAWASAYPLDIFPEPDFAKAHALLSAGGMTLDAISASNMRHVVEGVGGIARAALKKGSGNG